MSSAEFKHMFLKLYFLYNFFEHGLSMDYREMGKNCSETVAQLEEDDGIQDSRRDWNFYLPTFCRTTIMMEQK